MTALGSTKGENKHLKLLLNALDLIEETHEIGVEFTIVDGDLVRVVIRSVPSFGNAPGMNVQLGLVLIMVEDQNEMIKVHYRSSRCHRMSRSVTAAEENAPVYNLAHAYEVR